MGRQPVRLRSLEDESAKLKRLLAEAMRDNAGLKDLLAKIGTPAAKREAVARLRAILGGASGGRAVLWGLIGRACATGRSGMVMSSFG